MRSFGTPGYLLGDARVEVRVVYTAFLLFVLVGMATMAAFQLTHVGPRPAQIAAYWRGGDRDGAMLFPKTLREMIELTHFHAFTMGIVYLVLAHLFLATTASEAFKRAMVIVGFVGLLGDMLGVWLIRYVSAVFAWPQVAFWLGEWTAFAAYIAWPLHEMWVRHDE